VGKTNRDRFDPAEHVGAFVFAEAEVADEAEQIDLELVAAPDEVPEGRVAFGAGEEQAAIEQAEFRESSLRPPGA
jgi:hypothetical protein